MGLLTFEQAVAGCANAYIISSPILLLVLLVVHQYLLHIIHGLLLCLKFSDLDPRNSIHSQHQAHLTGKYNGK